MQDTMYDAEDLDVRSRMDWGCGTCYPGSARYESIAAASQSPHGLTTANWVRRQAQVRSGSAPNSGYES